MTRERIRCPSDRLRTVDSGVRRIVDACGDIDRLRHVGAMHGIRFPEHCPPIAVLRAYPKDDVPPDVLRQAFVDSGVDKGARWSEGDRCVVVYVPVDTIERASEVPGLQQLEATTRYHFPMARTRGPRRRR